MTLDNLHFDKETVAKELDMNLVDMIESTKTASYAIPIICQSIFRKKQKISGPAEEKT